MMKMCAYFCLYHQCQRHNTDGFGEIHNTTESNIRFYEIVIVVVDFSDMLHYISALPLQCCCCLITYCALQQEANWMVHH